MKHFAMKKSWLGVAMAALMMVSAAGLSACGEPAEEETMFGDYEYAVKNGAVEIIGYVGEGGALTIPSAINGKAVTSIAKNVFYYCDSLVKIAIPGSVKSIGASVFKGCNGLMEVSLGEGVEMIGYGAFYDCGSLSEITIPNSVTSIGWQAFTNCGGLERVVLGSGVQSVGDYAFAGCEGLEEVYYVGTESAWNAMEMNTYNECLIDAERYYFSNTQPTDEGNFWHYVDGVVTKW